MKLYLLEGNYIPEGKIFNNIKYWEIREKIFGKLEWHKDDKVIIINENSNHSNR